MTSGSRPRGETDLGVLVERLRGARIPAPPPALLVERVRAVTTDARFVAAIHDLAVDGSTLSQVSGLAARWLLVGVAAGGEAEAVAVAILDAVRRTRANGSRADRALAELALAGFVVAGCPGRKDARGLPRADDGELLTMARGNAETAALVAACLDEERATGDSIYRIVATLVVRRASS